MELVLKLGLLCSHNDPKFRPTMRQVVQYLEKDAPLPQDEMLALEIGDSNLATSIMMTHGESCEDFAMLSWFC